MFGVYKEVFYDTFTKGNDDKGKYKELMVFFSEAFGDQLANELRIKGHVNEGIVKIYSPKGDLDIDIIYFEENANGLMSMKKEKLDFNELQRETICKIIADTVQAFKDV